jgi:hypothetical protein
MAMGVGVAASKMILSGSRQWRAALVLAIVSSITYIVLDLLAPKVGEGARQGAGWRHGMNMIGGSRCNCLPNKCGCQNKLSESKNLQVGGMDSQVALDYYGETLFKLNGEGDPNLNPQTPTVIKSHNIAGGHSDLPDILFQPRAPGHLTESLPLQQGGTHHGLMQQELAQIDTLGRSLDQKATMDYYNEEGNVGPLQTSDNVKGVPDGLFSHNVDLAGQIGGETASERGLVFGTVRQAPHGGHATRVDKVLYSGDLVHLIVKDTSGRLILKDDQISIGNDDMGNRLFKFRLIKVDGHSSLKLIPIRYGDLVHLVYNDESGQTVKLNHAGGKINNLKSHRDTVFQLSDSQNPSSNEVANLGDVVNIICRDGYLLQHNGHILSNGKQGTSWILQSHEGCGPLWRWD